MVIDSLEKAFACIEGCSMIQEESVVDCFDCFPTSLTTREYADCLLELGIITKDTAKEYPDKYSVIELYDSFDWYSEQFYFLTNVERNNEKQETTGGPPDGAGLL